MKDKSPKQMKKDGYEFIGTVEEKQSNFEEMLRKTANDVRTKKEKDTKMVKRIDNYLAGKKEINPSITMCFNAKYNNVKVK